MGAIRIFAHRAWMVFPFTLPLWFATRVPAIRADEFAKMATYVAALFAVPIALDVLGGRPAPPPAAAGRPHRTAHALIPRLLGVKLIILQVFLLYYVGHEKLFGLDALATPFITGLYFGTLGIVVAHELFHRPSRADQWLGVLALCTVSYPHFRIEHVYGHHRTVATPADPATARLGESVYAFLVRSIALSFVDAWRLEAARLRAGGRPFWSRHNRMLIYAGLMALYYGLAYALAGLNGIVAVLAQSAAAIIALEVTNYIQHYGLTRRELAPGRYEAPAARHSWNWETRFSGLYFLNLGRHSQHHRHATRPYEALAPSEEAPMLPGGYLSMFMAALIPPLWFRLMNRRVIAWRRARDGLETPADPAALARSERRRTLYARLDPWGGYLMAAGVLAIIGATGPFGFRGMVIATASVTLVLVAAREAYVFAAYPPRAMKS